jgi:hypothetical protein
MELEQLMQSLAERLNLDPPEPYGKDEYRYTFDEDLTVRCLTGGKETVILCGAVAAVPGDEREADELLKRMLKLNLARMKTQKEVLSLDRESGEVILYLKVPTKDLSAEDFEEVMEAFVNTLEYWSRNVKEGAGEGSSPFSLVFP